MLISLNFKVNLLLFIKQVHDGVWVNFYVSTNEKNILFFLALKKLAPRVYNIANIRTIAIISCTYLL